MWIKYDSCDLETLTSKAGNEYVAFALRGTKLGYKEEPDTPYMKPLFDNTTVTVVEKGIERPNQSAVGFLHAAVKPGDTVELRFERIGGMPELVKMENRSTSKPTYTPLTDEQVAAATASQAAPAPIASAQPAQGAAQFAGNVVPMQAPQAHATIANIPSAAAVQYAEAA